MIHPKVSIIHKNAIMFTRAFVLHTCLEMSHNQNTCHSVIELSQRHSHLSLHDFSTRFKTVALKLTYVQIHLVVSGSHFDVSSCAVDTASKISHLDREHVHHVCPCSMMHCSSFPADMRPLPGSLTPVPRLGEAQNVTSRTLKRIPRTLSSSVCSSMDANSPSSTNVILTFRQLSL